MSTRFLITPGGGVCACVHIIVMCRGLLTSRYIRVLLRKYAAYTNYKVTHQMAVRACVVHAAYLMCFSCWFLCLRNPFFVFDCFVYILSRIHFAVHVSISKAFQGQVCTTPGSMNSPFRDFVMEFWRGILGGVRDYLGEMFGGFFQAIPHKPRLGA